MRFVINMGKLAFNFIRDVILSGWDTARVKQSTRRSGWDAGNR